MKFLELYIGAVILWTVFYEIGRILFEEKEKIKYPKVILTILFFALILAFLNIINLEIFKGVLKIISVYSLYCLFYKIIFKKTWSKILTAALILYLCLFVSEIIIILISSIIFSGFHDSMLFLKNNIIMNLLISLFDYFIIRVSASKLTLFVKNSDFSRRGSLIIILIILITLALLVFRIPVTKWRFNIDFVITMIILFCFCIIGLFLLKQKADIHRTTSMYQQLVEYSDITNNLLEDYRVVSHEHKNQLSIIRSMIDENNQELIEYIDNLLDKRDIIKYQWIGELNHLPLSGLKGLINYKLIEMENRNININISISKDIAKTKLNRLSTKQKDNLYSIIGVYLDNAIEANKKVKRKEISLEVYKEKKDIVFIIANTYTGKIELDKIDNYGYTTKGKNHGIGLHIVKKILEEDTTFSQKRSLFENYYVQELRIHLDEIKK